MTLILDAAPLVALADAKEPRLEALLRIRDEEEGPLVLPAPVAAEVDYLLGVRFGHAARRAFLSDLAAWRYEVACLEAGDYRVVADLGLADCSTCGFLTSERCLEGRTGTARSATPLDKKGQNAPFQPTLMPGAT